LSLRSPVPRISWWMTKSASIGSPLRADQPVALGRRRDLHRGRLRRATAGPVERPRRQVLVVTDGDLSIAVSPVLTLRPSWRTDGAPRRSYAMVAATARINNGPHWPSRGSSFSTARR
jgi:hypothetical protein